MRPRALPDALTGGPFLARSVDDLGVSRERLRRGDVIHPFHGVANAGPGPTTLTERAQCLALTLPEQAAFSHTTALELQGIPTPGREAADAAVHVMFRTTAGRSRRPGCVGHRGLESRAIETVDGLPLVGLADTWCDLGELVSPLRWTVADLVVTGDEILARAARAETVRRASEVRWLYGLEREVRKEAIALEGAERCRAEISERLARRVRPRGKHLLCEALPLLRHRSKSPMESRARVMFVLDGLPEPELNVTINAADGAGFIGECDFVWRARKVVGEYQGEHHADRRQSSADEAKRRLLEDDGWTVLPIWAEDVFHVGRRHDLLLRLHGALD